MKTKDVSMTAIREYGEGRMVTVVNSIIGENEFHYSGKDEERLVVCARNEGGYNGTVVDLLDVINWVKANRPDLLI